jgi:hypothetical protein
LNRNLVALHHPESSSEHQAQSSPSPSLELHLPDLHFEAVSQAPRKGPQILGCLENQHPTTKSRPRPHKINALNPIKPSQLIKHHLLNGLLHQHAPLRRRSYRRPPLHLRRCLVRLSSPLTSHPCTNKPSTIRQVPDHQEVYLDKDGFTSIIFDITERVGLSGSGPAVDGAALTIHLEEIVDSDTDTVKVWNTSNTQFSKLPFVPLSTHAPSSFPSPSAF